MKIVRATAALLLLWAGCSDYSPGLVTDGGVADHDAMAPPVAPGEFDDLGARGCTDGLDNNFDGITDCEDTSCRANLPSCCVGVVDAMCCVAGAPAELTIEACAGTFSECADASGYELFGARAPSVADAEPAVVPNGEELTDSGAVRRELIDPRLGDIRVHATVAMGERIDGELETLGFGLIDGTTSPASLVTVVPRVGVVFSRNRGAVMLMIGGERVDSAELTDTSALEYTLTVRANGEVSVALGQTTEEPLEGTLRLEEPVRLALWGRTPETSTEAPRLTKLSLAQDRCDMPAALTPGPVVVPAPADPDPTWPRETVTLSRPHVLRFDDGTGERTWMALRADGHIHVAEPGAGGFVDAVGDRVLRPPQTVWAEDGLDHPKLRFADGALELWFTGYDARGHGTVAVARWDGSASRFVDPTPVEGLVATGDASFEGAAPFEAFGRRLIAVRVSTDAGHRLSLFELGEDGQATERAVLTAPRPDELSAFDRDEVDAPAVVEHGGVYRLYYGARLGNQWSLALLVSDDGLEWHAPGGAIAGPGSGFDALGRRDPAPFVEDGQLSVYYAGTDGVFTRIGVLDGPAN